MRVAIVQEQARRALTGAAGFAVAGAVAAVVPHRTGAWLPLHLFLVGAVLLAISGATRLFVVTWSAAEPVAGAVVVAQRWAVGAGAAGLAAARELDLPTAFAGAAGTLVLAGLVLLGGLLVVEGRRGRVDRFRAARAYYLAAVVAGLGGGGLGAAMVTGGASVRDAHVVLNLLGLVGLVVAGTLPSFTATQARMKMSPRATPTRLGAALAVLVAAVAVATSGTLTGHPGVAAVALAAYAAAIAYVVTLLPSPGEKQLRWAGPRLVQLGLGLAWWVGSVLAAAWQAAHGFGVFPERVVVALVVGGYAQILVASLAYLGPVLVGGGHERLSAGFATTRSRTAVVAANVAGVAWLARLDALVVASVAVLAADVLWRAVRLSGSGARLERTADPSD